MDEPLLAGLDVGGFKAFDTRQHIPMAPITLLFGPNSSGKSTAIHALLLARGAAAGDPNWDARQVAEDLGQPVDLGGYDQFRHRTRAAKRHVSLGLQCLGSAVRREIETYIKYSEEEIGHPDDVLRNVLAVLRDIGSFEIEVEVAREKIEDRSNVGVVSSTFVIDNREWVSFRGGRVSKFDTTHPCSDRMLEMLVRPDRQPAGADRSELRRFVATDVLPGIEAHISNGFGVDEADDIFERAEPNALAFPWIELFFAVLEWLTNTAVAPFSRVAYEGPLRSYPARLATLRAGVRRQLSVYPIPGVNDVWAELAENAELRREVNTWLGGPGHFGMPYEIKVDQLVSAADVRAVLKRSSKLGSDPAEALMDAMKRDRMPVLDRTLLVDKRVGATVTARDVGVGVSQLLPVIASTLTTGRRLVMIEQPELHLHPALQAKLGDLFIEGARRGNQMVVETHSEHLILRLQRRIREGALEPGQVAVVYIEPSRRGSTATRLALDGNGSFVDEWPGGFFEERFYELFPES